MAEHSGDCAKIAAHDVESLTERGAVVAVGESVGQIADQRAGTDVDIFP